MDKLSLWRNHHKSSETNKKTKLTAYVKMFLLCERLVTQRALEGADPGVEQHVTLQVPTIIKHLAALLARQSRCAAVRTDAQVLAQTQLSLVDLAAPLAGVVALWTSHRSDVAVDDHNVGGDVTATLAAVRVAATATCGDVQAS